MKKYEKKNEKEDYITNVLAQRINLQLFNKHHQINFAVQLNACTVRMAQKDLKIL